MSIFDLQITLYSTALYTTWIFIDQWKLLFDAGDGVTAGLLHKSRKVQTVALTHADRDHLAGLLQFLQLNGRPGAPRLLYPRDSNSFRSLAAFTAQFDPTTSAGVVWQAVAPGDVIPLQKQLQLRVRPSLHWRDVPADQVKVVAYTVQHAASSLRPDLLGLPQAELDAIRLRDGRDSLMNTRTHDLLTFSGDTPLMPADAWGQPQLLIHEATFLDDETAADAAATRYNRHSGLPGVLDMALALAPQGLILTHFSLRYAPEEIIATIQREAQQRQLPFPVWAVMPGEIQRDILHTPPVWG